MQIQLAVLQSLTAHVAQFGDTAMEFLLQKVLMVLTYLHRRAAGTVPHQLQGLAIACFTALRAADTCEVRSFVAKLQAWLLCGLSSCPVAPVPSRFLVDDNHASFVGIAKPKLSAEIHVVLVLLA